MALMCAGAALAEVKTVTLASLEWPPYTGAKLPEQGASVAVARAAFKAMGYELKVEFYPWSRAVQLAKNSPGHAGYFPEYYSDELKNDFVLSEPMGSGPLGLAQRNDKPLNWSKISDLSAIKVGVVQDYLNTTEFDARVAAKQQRVDVAPDDSRNLMKLGAGRIDAAVVDSNVFTYLLKTDPQLKPYVGQLSMNPRLMEDKKLYICFKKGAEGERIARVFNEGLKKIDISAIMAKHL
ncbi:substrate-binding periplasmic protein [Chitinimonas lacunae]|uniref:Substrate-binding periplasmic protein n=1 Tax=Chitinimonas lacunae TaxID=1963018 RepID=A0ABV8ML28_9NEIS